MHKQSVTKTAIAIEDDDDLTRGLVAELTRACFSFDATRLTLGCFFSSSGFLRTARATLGFPSDCVSAVFCSKPTRYCPQLGHILSSSNTGAPQVGQNNPSSFCETLVSSSSSTGGGKNCPQSSQDSTFGSSTRFPQLEHFNTRPVFGQVVAEGR